MTTESRGRELFLVESRISRWTGLRYLQREDQRVQDLVEAPDGDVVTGSVGHQHFPAEVGRNVERLRDVSPIQPRRR